MRKHSVRKWIHAILDLFPLLVIPIFAINIINRSVEPLSVEYGDVHTEINYLYQTNDVNDFLNDLVIGNVYHSDELTIDDNGEYILCFLTFDTIDFGTNYLDSVDESIIDNYNSNNDNYLKIVMDGDWYFHFTNNNSYVSLISGFEDAITIYNTDFYIEEGLEDFIFVSGIYENSITSSDFNIIESVEEVHDTVIYNDTDIGSQFVYSLYHVTDKYFNMNNTFNLGQVYEWFSTNIFGGVPPLALPIVWNVIIYEFIMDLLFLLYAVFMFIIDFAESFIERMFDKTRCGGR